MKHVKKIILIAIIFTVTLRICQYVSEKNDNSPKASDKKSEVIVEASEPSRPKSNIPKKTIVINSQPEIVVKAEPITAEEDLFTEDEWYEIALLSQTMFREAGGTGNSNQIKSVGASVCYRVDDPEYPDTVREVLFQPSQYAEPQGKTSDECRAAAIEVYKLWKQDRLDEVLPEGYIYFYGDGQYNHFYNESGNYITPL